MTPAFPLPEALTICTVADAIRELVAEVPGAVDEVMLLDRVARAILRFDLCA